MAYSGRTLSETHEAIDQHRQQALQRSRDALRLAVETRDVGADTLATLDAQREQLQRVEERLDHMNGNLKKAEGTLSRMEKWFGLVSFSWHRNPEKTNEYRGLWGTKGSNSSSSQADARSSVRHDCGGGGEAYARGGSGAAAGRARATGAAHGGGKGEWSGMLDDPTEAEFNENLDGVGDVLKDLAVQARQMGQELDDGNATLDRLRGKTDFTRHRVNKASGRTVDLLH